MRVKVKSGSHIYDTSTPVPIRCAVCVYDVSYREGEAGGEAGSAPVTPRTRSTFGVGFGAAVRAVRLQYEFGYCYTCYRVQAPHNLSGFH